MDLVPCRGTDPGWEHCRASVTGEKAVLVGTQKPEVSRSVAVGVEVKVFAHYH